MNWKYFFSERRRVFHANKIAHVKGHKKMWFIQGLKPLSEAQRQRLWWWQGEGREVMRSQIMQSLLKTSEKVVEFACKEQENEMTRLVRECRTLETESERLLQKN